MPPVVVTPLLGWLLVHLTVVHGRVEELGDHRDEQVGAGRDPMMWRGPADMRSGGEHRQRRGRQTVHVTVPLAAAQQAKELHRMRQAHAVTVPHKEQHGALERRR
jgi:hypothetical protein